MRMIPSAWAAFLAPVPGGEALPVPPFPEPWIAFAGHDEGTAIEVYPLTPRLKTGPEPIACKTGVPDDSPTFAHLAVRSALDRHEIADLGTAETWVTRICNRGPFDCGEVWPESGLLVEASSP